MNLTDEELDAIESVIYDHVFYGPDEIVYGDGPEAVTIRDAWSKLYNEQKLRESNAV